MGGSRAVTCHHQPRDRETAGQTSSPSGDTWVRFGYCRGTGWDVPAPHGTLHPPGTCSCQLSQLNCESWPRPFQILGMADTPGVTAGRWCRAGSAPGMPVSPPAATHISRHLSHPTVAPHQGSQCSQGRGSRVSYLPVTAVLCQVEHWQRSCHHQAQPLHKHRMMSRGPSLASGPRAAEGGLPPWQGRWGMSCAGSWGQCPHPPAPWSSVGPQGQCPQLHRGAGVCTHVSLGVVGGPGVGVPTCTWACVGPWGWGPPLHPRAGGSLPRHPGRHWSTGPAWLGSQPEPWVCPAHPGTPARTQDTVGATCLLALAW